jgi:hypothetical protein
LASRPEVEQTRGEHKEAARSLDRGVVQFPSGKSLNSFFLSVDAMGRTAVNQQPTLKHKEFPMRARSICPITLSPVEKRMLVELSTQSKASMCDVVRQLILKEVASRSLAPSARYRRHEEVNPEESASR